MRIARSSLILAGACFLAVQSFAHHSKVGRYDRDNIIEIEGLVTDLTWGNPHVYIELESSQAGEPVVWKLEAPAFAFLQRAGIRADSIRVGDRISVAGMAPLTGAYESFLTNLRLPSGQELLLVVNATPRWSESVIGDYSYTARTEGDSSRPELGLFRVWTTPSVDWVLSGVERAIAGLPLTKEGRVALEQFNPATDAPTLNCVPKGMPTIMDQPYPIAFEDRGRQILMRIEEYDTVRIIHIEQQAASEGAAASPLGYSLGRREEDTLVVTTTHLNWPFFHQLGIPQTEDSVLVERFRVSADGGRLDYELTVSDPAVFTEPIIGQRYWYYRPGEEIKPYDCRVRE